MASFLDLHLEEWCRSWYADAIYFRESYSDVNTALCSHTCRSTSFTPSPVSLMSVYLKRHGVWLKTSWLWLSALACGCFRWSPFHSHFYHGAHLRVTECTHACVCVLLTSDPTKCCKQSESEIWCEVKSRLVKADMQLIRPSSSRHLSQWDGIFQNVS